MFAYDKDIRLRAMVLLLPVAAMWLVHAIDALVPGSGSVAGIGVIPRTIDGLYGIITAPLIHVDWGHLAANSVPLLVLGGIVLLRGFMEYFLVVVTSVVVGGLGTWLFGAPHTQHVGASGIVFGLFGYLVFRVAFDRKLATAVITVMVAVAYGSAIVWSLVPQPDISWSGHFFGFVGGFMAARLRYPHVKQTEEPAAESSLLRFPKTAQREE